MPTHKSTGHNKYHRLGLLLVYVVLFAPAIVYAYVKISVI